MISRSRSFQFSTALFSTGIMVLGFGVAPATQAQEPRSAAVSTVLEEVVVTAQKREESLQDVPISIIAYTSEDLVNLGVKTIQDVSETTPNLVMPTVGNSNHEISPAIRGVSGAEVSTVVNTKVAIYLDGVYVGKNSGAIFSMPNLERIEVLRGPQGTLFGRNSTGGALNVVTRTPESALNFQQDFSVGNDGIFQSKSYLQVPISDTVAGSLSYVHSEDDGDFRNTFPGAEKNLGSEDSDAIATRLHWDATDNLSLDYGYDYFDGESMPRPTQLSYYVEGLESIPVLTGQPNPYAEAVAAGAFQFDDRIDKFNLNFMDKNSLEVSGHNLTLQWSVSDTLTVKSITGYRETDQLLRKAQLDGGAWSIPLAWNAKNRSTEHEQFSQEFQFIGTSANDRWEYVAGLYYFDEDGKDHEAEGRQLSVPIPTASSAFAILPFTLAPQRIDFSASSKAAYGQVSYTPDILDHRLQITLGVRYTSDESEITKNAESFSGGIVNDISTDHGWTNTSGLLVLNYTVVDDTMVFFKVAEGYTSGILPFRASSATVFQKNSADAETLLDYEIGIKSSLMNNRLRVNATAFYYDYTDIQVNDSINGNPIITNGGSATSKGVELELTAIVFEGLQLGLNYGYLDSSYDELLLIDSADLDGNILGFRDVGGDAGPGFSPEHSGSVTARYIRPLGDWAEFSAFLDVTYTDEYYASPRSANNPVEAHTLINARLGLGNIRFGGGELSFALWGKNLADEEYRDFGSDFSDSLGFAYNQWGRARTYGLDLRYEFK